MTIGKFIFGLIVVGIGFLIIWKADWIMINFGRVGWADQHLGTEGGSRVFYKLLGSIIIIVGFMIATDLTDNLLAWIAKSIFRQEIPE
ncbi:hypothetical protein K8R42_05315 [bacterium]|nr:hypothetical protein [bacterium]